MYTLGGVNQVEGMCSGVDHVTAVGGACPCTLVSFNECLSA